MNRRHFMRGSIAGAVAAALAPQQSFSAALRALTLASSDIEAVSGSGAAVVLEKAAVNELGARLRGNLLLTGSEGYDVARRVMNASIDKYPALIVQPSGVADIQQAINFARERELLLAVKCGGHSWSGKSTCDGGMVLDLSTFRNVRVDAAKRRAYVAGGSLLGELDHESMAHGLVTTAGTVSHTGVSGLTLGGGFGRVARRFGLALDNVKSVDIVNADGQLRRASAEENEDLYWGVRGGGGNFGVVTSFEFALHPMPRTVTAGEVVFPLARVKDVLSFYSDFSVEAPENLYVDFIINAMPGEPGVCLLHVCHSGTPAEAERDLAPIAKLGQPIVNTIAAADYVAVQRAFDNSDPRAAGEYVKSGFVTGIDEKLVQAIADGFETDPSRGTMFFFQVAGGAIQRVADDATAFPHRYASHMMATVINWPLDSNAEEPQAWQRRYWSTLEPFTDGYYTNETANEGQQVINRNYRGNYERLLAVKKRYDPGNLFRLNANIRPA
ncbi:MAG TPA: FAD-dependent oxidoreductase [Woeseiaceae bacterium]